jgi:hypothetical protein
MAAERGSGCAAFWHDLVEDPAPLASLADADLRALAALLDILGVADV